MSIVAGRFAFKSRGEIVEFQEVHGRGYKSIAPQKESMTFLASNVLLNLHAWTDDRSMHIHTLVQIFKG